MASARLGARLRVVAVGTTLAAGTLLSAMPTATAAQTATTTTHHRATAASTRHTTARQRFTAKADRVLRVARTRRGDPYSYGAAGPHAFDCSGLVMWVFKRALDRSLPHNAAEQYRVSKHLHKRSNLRPGDLIFVDNGGSISHVGIFAGHGYWWVAPHTGGHVHKQRIYSAHFKYGRIIHA